MIDTITTNDYLVSADHAKAARMAKTDEERLKAACQGFEAMFMQQMMKAMRSASDTLDSGLIKKSNGEKIFTEMLDQELSDVSSKSSVNGLADIMFEQLKHTIVTEEDSKDGAKGIKTNMNIEGLNRLNILM